MQSQAGDILQHAYGRYLADDMHVQLLHGGNAMKAHPEGTRVKQWLVCMQRLHPLLICFPSRLQHARYAYPKEELRL